MSRLPNLFVLALGITTLLLGVAYGVATRYQMAAERQVMLQQVAAVRPQFDEAKSIDEVPTTTNLADAEDIGSENRIATDRDAKASVPAPNSLRRLGIGRPALPAEIAAWDVDIMPDGHGLPEGRGDVETGEAIFSDYCASCHGDFAEGVDNWPVLAGGFDTLAEDNPIKTIGSYWPHLSTVWDYIQRSMPFGSAQTLDEDQVYAIVAYLLYSNDLVDESFALSHENFADILMPNVAGFVVDDRAETEYALWRKKPCMQNCKESVNITMRASDLDVTPEPIRLETSTTHSDGEVSDKDIVKNGQKVFKKCQTCHQVGAQAKHRVGPHLNKIFGRVIGGLEDFRYSQVFDVAAKEGQIWDEESMAAFLLEPRTYFQGTKMAFSGLRTADEIAGVIAYLKTYSD